MTAFQRYGVKTSEKANVRSIAHAPSLAGYIAHTHHVNYLPEHALRHVGCTIDGLLSVLISVLFVFNG